MSQIDQHLEAVCQCGHSSYDHIGWRLIDPSDKRVSCRIIRCGCEAYTKVTNQIYEYEVKF